MVAVLFNAGDQVPLNPLFDVVGNADNVAPEQMGDTALKVGVVDVVTITSICALGLSQPPTFWVT